MIQGWMNSAELAWLHNTASQSTACVEVGAWKGLTTQFLCSACPGPVYVVDHWQGSRFEPDGAFAEAKTNDVHAEFIRNVGHYENIRVRRGNSTEIAPSLPIVDFVFLDGGHTYEEVKADIAAWKSKALKVLAGHDYGAEQHPGVKQAVDEAFGDRVRIVPGTTIWFVTTPVERHILMATPAYGGLVHADFMVSVMATANHLRANGVSSVFSHRSGDSLVPRSRIALFAEFLRNPDYTHLMFLDGDLRFPAWGVLKLIQCDKPLVAGIYPIKSLEPKFPFNPIAQEARSDESGCFAAKDLPTGFMMIRRDCAEQMVEAYADRRCRIASGPIDSEYNQECYDVFPCFTDTDRMYLSEDFGFTRLWQAIGGTAWAQPSIPFGHKGSHEFEGCLSDHLKVKEAA